MDLMKTALVLLLITAFGGGAAVAQRQSDPNITMKGSGKLPAGWQMRLDDPRGKPEAVSFMMMNGGPHVMTGPAAIFYKPDMTKSGTYEVSATFTQMAPAPHPEAYGLFIGGSDLQGPNQKYTYFMIQQDGTFLLKRRAGAATPVIQDWKANGAVKKTEGKTQGVNTLTVSVAPDKVRFLINGTEVGTASPSQVDASGIVGLRINHNLNVHVASFDVK